MNRYLAGAAITAFTLSVGGAAVSAKPGPTGNLSVVTPAPTAGQPISFLVTVNNLPTSGGATTMGWVDLECSIGNTTVFAGTDAADRPVVPNVPGNQFYADFVLDSAAWLEEGYAAASCDANLFYDGANNPRRRKTNSLASLSNLPIAGVP